MPATNHDSQVSITINSDPFQVAQGSHRVSELKSRAGLPAMGELGEIRNGEYHALQDNQSVAIRGGEQFRSPEIIVNGTPERWLEQDITYTQVVTLFDPQFPQHQDVTYSVVYDHGPRQNPE